MAINEVLEALVPENARFVSGQDIYLYVPKARTDRRYGLAKYSPNDFSIDTNGVLTLLLPTSQIEDYLKEIRGGTREQTVVASPKINLLNLYNTSQDIYKKISDLQLYDITHDKKDQELQKNIDFIIQDDRASDALDSTYSASKIVQLIKEAKMEGLHFVGYIGKDLGKDEDGSSIVKEGALWHVSSDTEKPTIDGSWSADTMYKCINGEWVASTEYVPADFDIWKNIDLQDSEINTWWFFDNQFEVLDFNVDMDLYYTKVQSDHRFKSNFTYGDYLKEENGILNIDNLVMPTSAKYSYFNRTNSNLTSLNVEDAIKELEDHTDAELKLINDRPILLTHDIIPTREGDYCIHEDGVYKSVSSEDGFKWELVTTDLDDLLPRINADKNISKGLLFYNDEETGYLLSKMSMINLNTEEESETSINVPVATTKTDGIMPATAMKAIEQLDMRLTAIASGVKSYFVEFDSDEPSQTALTILYQDASGKTDDPPDMTRLIDVERNIYYEYEEELDVHWRGPFVYKYDLASLEQAGIVRSSEQKGQIYVEPVTGLMSLNGYNDIISTFNSLYGGSERTSIAVSQVPDLPASKINSGTLNKDRLPIVPISKGGTGNTAFSANKLIISSIVDQTDESKNQLMDGPAFGALDTILVGRGATQVPIFKSISELGLAKQETFELYLPLSGGTVTGSLYATELYQNNKQVANKEDLNLFVKNTDYSTNDTAGIVRTGSGLSVSTDGILNTDGATTSIIDAKSDTYRPITSSVIDYAVKSSLSYSKLSWSEDEKSLARSTLGVDGEITKVLASSKSYTDEKVAALIDSAPETLDTFKEIAEAFAEDQEVLDTLNSAIGLKADQSSLDETNTKVTALETDKADKSDVPTTYLESATVTNDILTVNKSDGTSFQFEGGGGYIIRRWD